MAEGTTPTPEATTTATTAVTASTRTATPTTTEPEPAGSATTPNPKAARSRQRRPPLNQIYALPAPIRTFPLPAFHPTNPLSLAILASTWVAQVVSPPVEPSVVHDGIWYPESKSVHIIDPKSMRQLWEQGFYGKGNLSRSEPHWLEREKTRVGLTSKLSSEHFTAQRREARQKTKWERARVQQEAIEQTRRDEAERMARSATRPPTGPLALLALPNSPLDLEYQTPVANSETNGHAKAPTSKPDESLAPSSHTEETIPLTNVQAAPSNGVVPPNGVLKIPSTSPVCDSGTSEDSKSPKSLKRQKSVRFSPTVKATTFKLSDPPNPNAAAPRIWSRAFTNTTEWVLGLFPTPRPSKLRRKTSPMVVDIDNMEHLQLTPEEAFFLAFAFGALRVLDPSTKDPIPLERIFLLFRQVSYVPPRIDDSAQLRPDDPFLLHYVVYHHFRSIGWCVRSGIKFGVDWLLYLRGPVFNHAEFGILVLPSYSDEWWKACGQAAPQKSWNWLSGIGRTLSQVYKSLVIVYVDIPSPPVFEEALGKEGFAGAFGCFQVREIMMGRWLHNRNRSAAPGSALPRPATNGDVKK